MKYKFMGIRHKHSIRLYQHTWCQEKNRKQKQQEELPRGMKIKKKGEGKNIMNGKWKAYSV